MDMTTCNHYEGRCDHLVCPREILLCPGCKLPAHASETDDGGYHPGCAAPALTVVASSPRPSSCLPVAGAVDVDVTVTLPGGDPLEGEVTLAPRQYDGQLASYGSSPDHWVSGALLRALRGLSDLAFRAALDQIEAAAADVVDPGSAAL